jgi:arsenate reductase (thioredoxin)
MHHLEVAMSEHRPVDPSVQAGLDQVVARLHEEFEGIFPTETIAEVVDDSHDVLGSYRLVTYVPLLVHRFAREHLRSIAVVEGQIVTDQPEVLFVCVHNAGRSQMAAALLAHHAQGGVTVRSAGSTPADQINPAVIEAMNEIGLDLSQEFPKPLTTESVQAADVVITMGCGDACPIFPGKRYLDWALEDPAGKDVDTVRRIRDDIDGRIQTLLAELTQSSANTSTH